MKLDCAPEDPVQKDKQVVLALVGELPAAPDAPKPRAPELDLLDSQVLDIHRAERRQQVHVDHVSVAPQRRWLAFALLGGEAQELGGGLGECDAGTICRLDCRAGHVVAVCRPSSSRAPGAVHVVERVAQPVLGAALGEVAGGRATAALPCRSDLTLDLSSIGQAVFGPPGWAANLLEPEDVTRRATRARWKDGLGGPGTAGARFVGRGAGASVGGIGAARRRASRFGEASTGRSYCGS